MKVIQSLDRRCLVVLIATLLGVSLQIWTVVFVPFICLCFWAQLVCLRIKKAPRFLFDFDRKNFSFPLAPTETPWFYHPPSSAMPASQPASILFVVCWSQSRLKSGYFVRVIHQLQSLWLTRSVSVVPHPMYITRYNIKLMRMMMMRRRMMVPTKLYLHLNGCW